MPDYNMVILMGRLSSDPELRYTPNGTACTDFSIAVNRRLGQDRQETMFLGCVAFGKLAETISRFLQKGASVFVKGYLRQENWQTREGQKRSTIRLVCDEFHFLDRKGQQDNPPPEPAPPPTFDRAPGHRYTRSDIPESMNPAPPQTPAPAAASDPHFEDVQNVPQDDIPF
jgi:single-strand DNA-binding protein